jgi:hypothetical protein
LAPGGQFTQHGATFAAKFLNHFKRRFGLDLHVHDIYHNVY